MPFENENNKVKQKNNGSNTQKRNVGQSLFADDEEMEKGIGRILKDNFERK